MSNVVLKAENISKQYRLGQLGTGTISHDLNRMWAKMRGKEDPYLKIGDTNDRSKVGGSDYVWSLKDINFEVKQGEVLGIIGKNGAGKSTLLKILSQVTTPTTGEVNVKGRIAALLEVGTGFHPELTGRENIFLNGTILGMTKVEIKSKFDEIVDFSGVAKYLDTPVKRYSSGMMVRLGFAVAAHLEPEILIVDEVLAVGDAEFQKKCLGKMKDVSGQGRTVLFVSHNITAIKYLCNTCLFLEKGELNSIGTTNQIINNYNNSNNLISLSVVDLKSRPKKHEIMFTGINLFNKNNNVIKSGDDLIVDLFYECNTIDRNANYEFVFGVWNNLGTPMFMITNLYLNEQIKISETEGKISFLITKLSLNKGRYTVNLLIKKNNQDQDFIENAFTFDVEDGSYYNTLNLYPEYYEGHYVDFKLLK
jgi:lipopolysaccharide transport system ATP-binding protein